MRDSYAEVWNALHKDFVTKNKISYDDWLDEFNSIIERIDTPIIDLGCGVTGNNTLYLLEKGKKVISCDFAEEALKEVSKIPSSEVLLFDMLNPFPFEDEKAELVIADLSLHYFREKDTNRIIQEIKRILKPSGYLFFRVNSTSSAEYKELIENGEKMLEANLFYSKNMEKRFFGENDLDSFFKGWTFLCKREENMARFCSNKIIWKCAVQNRK